MNAYQKQLINSKIENLEIHEREIQSYINDLKVSLRIQEEQLAKIQTEKKALQE
ncbi:hypothetical protein GJU40_01575 [Bacillus lacus]|uniref:Uncharacterized protein n=1 Tax=Metabacillus lacus TaxID=1983721 RepID=A0A7X2IW55_9BACI|nr:hypothetical protein [Metabacillus lacus]MRX70856.1 hypothetical protein [Metabacillus lacus]